MRSIWVWALKSERGRQGEKERGGGGGGGREREILGKGKVEGTPGREEPAKRQKSRKMRLEGICATIVTGSG